LVHGYTVAFAWGVGALALGAILCLILVTTHRASPAEDQETPLELAEVEISDV
jgi:hypothetical protein